MLLRAYPHRVFSVAEGPGRDYPWTSPIGDVVLVRAAQAGSEIQVWAAADSGEMTALGSLSCDYGEPEVWSNQREDGRLLLRYECVSEGQEPGDLRVILWERGGQGNVEAQRWQGTRATYRSSSAPAWTQLRRDADAGISFDVASVRAATACSSAADCNTRGDRLRLAGSFRLALGFYLAAGNLDANMVSPIFDSAQIYSALGDRERAITTLERLGGIHTTDAERAIRRIRTERDFRDLRDDPRIVALQGR